MGECAEADHKDNPTKITSDLQMPLCHLFPEWNYHSASLARYVVSEPGIRPPHAQNVPNRLTMYRPKKPVAPKTVAVCPENVVQYVPGYPLDHSTIPPIADLRIKSQS